jgi:hypothetical protein
LLALLPAGIIAQSIASGLLPDLLPPPPFTGALKIPLISAGILSAAGVFGRPLFQRFRLIAIALIFLGIACFTVKTYKNANIDVFMYQFKGAQLLVHGINPFDAHTARFPNIYGKETSDSLYGPGVVDSTSERGFPNGKLNYGFPYMPASLLITLPGTLLGNDPRYSDIAAILFSALLMALTRRGRIAPLAAALFLFTPSAFYIIRGSWTEPLLVLTFSFVMLTACRWRSMLPFSLGLFLATKQYAVLLVPLLPLLLEEGENSPREFFKLLAKATIVASVTTLPFVLWNFHEFWRSVVEWQFVQPFRTDSLSYLVTIANLSNGWRAPMWISLAFVIPAIMLALRHGSRTPAGFATGATFVFLVFFLFNKQAFSNYYYFVIATACWAVAAARVDENTPAENPVPATAEKS